MSICAPGEGTKSDNDGQIPQIPGTAGPGSPGVDTDVVLRDGICDDAEPIVIDTANGEYVKFFAKETQDAANMYLDGVPVSVIDGDTGLVHLTITGDDLPYAGIWWSAFIVFDTDDNPLHEIRTWLYIEKGIQHTISQNTPLSIAEVRLFLLDQCPADNYLLDDVEFSDTEYMAAIRWPIAKWNEMPPDVGRFTQTTCPWRYHWMVGAAAMLLRMAAHNYARNSLQYNAGGISLGDKTKDQQYKVLASELQAEFLNWMDRKKVEINQTLAFGGVYSWEFYSDAGSYL